MNPFLYLPLVFFFYYFLYSKNKFSFFLYRQSKLNYWKIQQTFDQNNIVSIVRVLFRALKLRQIILAFELKMLLFFWNNIVLQNFENILINFVAFGIPSKYGSLKHIWDPSYYVQISLFTDTPLKFWSPKNIFIPKENKANLVRYRSPLLKKFEKNFRGYS